MTRQEFIGRWAFHLPEEHREVFLADLVLLLALEQARERRRLCTDALLYARACAETADEIRRYASRDLGWLPRRGQGRAEARADRCPPERCRGQPDRP